jgi:hypothetical protein
MFTVDFCVVVDDSLSFCFVSLFAKPDRNRTFLLWYLYDILIVVHYITQYCRVSHPVFPESFLPAPRYLCFCLL